MNNNTELIFSLSDHMDRRKKSRSLKKAHDSIPAFLLKTYDILEVLYMKHIMIE